MLAGFRHLHWLYHLAEPRYCRFQMRFERFLEDILSRSPLTKISDHFFTLHVSSHFCTLTLTQNKYSK